MRLRHVLGHLSKFKVIGKKTVMILIGFYLSFGETLDVPTSHSDCLDQKVCHELDLSSVVQV